MESRSLENESTRYEIARRRDSSFLALHFFCSKPNAKDWSSNLGNTTLVCGLVKRTPGISRDNRNWWCNATPRVLLILILEWDGISVVLHIMRVCVLCTTHMYKTRIIVRPSDWVILAYLTSEIMRGELYIWSLLLPNTSNLQLYKSGLLLRSSRFRIGSKIKFFFF